MLDQFLCSTTALLWCILSTYTLDWPYHVRTSLTGKSNMMGTSLLTSMIDQY